jgi:hypothetical protein
MKTKTAVAGLGVAAIALGSLLTAAPAASAAPTATAAAPSKVTLLHVVVNGARLRSAPDGSIIETGINAGNGFDAYCWPMGTGAHFWFYGHVWGGKTGYMRDDMLSDGQNVENC